MLQKTSRHCYICRRNLCCFNKSFFQGGRFGVGIKLYNLAYRMTGDSLLSQKICLEVIENLSKQGVSWNDGCDKSIREVVRLFLNEYCYFSPKEPADNDQCAQVQRALNSLTVEERLVVVLRNIYGMSCAEIRVVVGYSDKKIYQILHEGLIKISSAL